MLIMFLEFNIGSINVIVEIVRNNRNLLIKDEFLSKKLILAIIDCMRDISIKEGQEGAHSYAGQIYKAKLMNSLQVFMQYEGDNLKVLQTFIIR